MNKYEIKKGSNCVAIVECPHHDNGLPRIGSRGCVECNGHQKVEDNHVICIKDELGPEEPESVGVNCEGKEFFVGDKITGLVGFGSFISGEIIKRNDHYGIERKGHFYPLSDFEGGFTYEEDE